MFSREVTSCSTLQQLMNYNYQLSHSGIIKSSNADLEEQPQLALHPEDELLSMLEMANLKHKLVSLHSGGVLLKATTGGSLTSPLEETLFHPQVQHVNPQMGCILPAVEPQGKMPSNSQSHLFDRGHHEQNPDLLLILRPPTDGLLSNAAPQYKPPLPGVVNSVTLTSSDTYLRDSTPVVGRKLSEVESNGGMLLPDISSIFMEPGKKMFSCALDSHWPAVHNTGKISRTAVDNFQDFLPSSTPIERLDYNQEAGVASASHSHWSYESWCSEYSMSATVEKYVEVKAELSVSGNKSTKMESGLLLDCLYKRHQQTCGVYSTSQNGISGDDIQDNLITHNNSFIGERKSCVHHESKECQALRSMYQQNCRLKENEVSELDDIIELVEEVHENIKRRESTNVSPASNDFQDHHKLSSPTLVQGLNEAYTTQERHQAVQQKTVKANHEENALSNDLPLQNLLAMELGHGQGLGVMDYIPQIEVRMLENKQMMIKISSRDRHGLFSDIMFALQDLQLQVQHANIRTIFGYAHDVLTAKVNVAVKEKQTTSDIAEAMRQAIEKGATSLSPRLASPNATLTSLAS